MKSQLLLIICKVSVIAGLLIAGSSVLAAPAETAASLSKSDFEDGSVKAPLRDPFFPKSTRYKINQVVAPPTTPAPGDNTPPPVVDCYADIIVKGLTISRAKRIATINGQQFAPGEEWSVKTPRGSLKLKVIEIKDRSVVVKAEGCEAKELPLKL